LAPDPDPEPSLAWNFLRGLPGEAPSPTLELDFDVCLVLHADHGLSASAFSARVTTSTLSGLCCSVLAAIGTLEGSLRDGTNEAVIRMLAEIGSPDRLDAFLDVAFATGHKVTGFGHRVPRRATRARGLRVRRASG